MERKISITLLVSTLMVWSSCVFACGPEIPEKYLSFFSTQFIGYAPLKESLRISRFSSPDLTALSTPTAWSDPRMYANLLEWQQYFKTFGLTDGQVQLETLDFLVYKLDRETLAEFAARITASPDKTFDIQQFVAEHDNNQWLAHIYHLFAFQQLPSSESVAEILTYLMFAKDCEVNSAQEHYWGEREEPDIALIRKLIEEGQTRYPICKTEWLKMRYAYQVVRLARYAGEYEEAVALYDELAAPLRVNSIIRYWALEHKTASLCQISRAAEASPLFAQVFEYAPELRDTAYYCFDLDALKNDTLRASPHEKAVLWMLATLAKSNRLSFEPLRRVYALAPQSALVESLLIRHLLEYEDIEFARHLEQPDNVALDTAYLAEFEQFVREAIRQNTIRRPALWLLAAGYLRFMGAFADHQCADAAQLFQQAEDAAGDDTQIRHQARLLRHVVTLYQPGRITKKFTDAFYPELQWLVDQRETAIFQTVMTALGQKLLSQDDVPQAACCFYAANNTMLWPEASISDKHAMANLVLDMYADHTDAERLVAFMSQSSYSAFETLLLRYLPFTREAALDIWGTHLLRQHAFKRALHVFEQISPAYWERDNTCGESWEAGVFCAKQFRTSFFDNAHHASGRFVQTNKADMTKQIVALEQQARRDRIQADQLYWQIANAFYNTPYWGYAGVLWNGSLMRSFKYEYGYHLRSHYAERNPPRKDFLKYPFNTPALKQAILRRENVFLQEYGTRALALEYYQRALKATKNNELAAELLAMSQECVVDPAMTSISSTDFLSEQADYFGQLHARYEQTAFHKQLLEECPEFEHYLRKNYAHPDN